MGILKKLLPFLLFASSAFATPTTYMALNLPDPGTTAGPLWAQQLNAAIQLIDSHDHSSGKGTKVTPSGMNISADLEFNSNDATELRTTSFTSQVSTLSSATTNAVYVCGGNLCFNNGSGGAVQITSGSAVVSSVSGAFAAAVPGAYPYTVSAGDAQKVLLVDTSAARTINLPAATTAVLFAVKDITGSASSNNITVVRDGTDTIDGAAANKTISENNSWTWFISDGVSGWRSAMSFGGTVSVAAGGTGATSASGARTALGVVIGTDVQAYDADLTVLGGLAKTDNNFIVGNGSAWVAESGSTARTSMGAAASGANGDITSTSAIASMVFPTTLTIFAGNTGGSVIIGGGTNTSNGGHFDGYSTTHGVYPGVAAVTGVGGEIILYTTTAKPIEFYPNGTLRYQVESGGDFTAKTAGKGYNDVVNAAVTAAGSDATGATLLTHRISVITAGASGTGVKLPATITIGGRWVIYNDTGSDKLVHANSGQTMVSLAPPAILLSGLFVKTECVGLTSTQWGCEIQ